MSEIEKLLEERGKEYKNFASIAAIAQEIKETISHRGWHNYPAHTREALDMIATKLARVVHNSYHIDSWRDIAGYAMLVVKELEKNNE